MILLLLAGCSAVLAACSYKADVVTSPSYSVASSYGEKIAGTWLLYVDSSKLDRPAKPSTYACSGHEFPIEASQSFTSSVSQTFDNLVDHLLMVDGPVESKVIRAQGARGLIVIRGEEIRPHFEVKPGFWSGSFDARALLVASITVDGVNGRLLGQTVEGQGFSTGDSGAMCSGGGPVLAAAIGQAMTDTMRKLGEAMANSERVRLAP